MATITSLGMNIFTKFDGSGVVAAHRAITSLDTRMRETNQSFIAATGRVNGLRLGLLALAPAATTVGAVVVGAGAAAATSFAMAGAAAGVYGGVLSATVKRVHELRKESAALNGEQASYIRTLDRMKDAWTAFLDSHESKTLSVARDFIDGITAGIGRLNPIIDATHPIVKRVSEAWKSWMEGDSSKRFADSIVTHGVPALDHLVSAGQNVLGAFGRIFRELIPYTVEFAQNIRTASASFDKWAFEGGFTRFVEFIKQNAPEVRLFFGALGAALLRVGEAMVTLAPAMLEVATIFLKLIANTPVEVLQALYIAFMALKGVQVVTSLINVLTAALGFLMSPVGMVVGAIAALAAGLIYLKTQTDFFETTWPVIWADVRKYAEPPLIWIIDTLEVLMDAFTMTFRSIRALVNGEYKAALTEMELHTDEHGNYLKDSWNKLYAALKNDVFIPGLATLREEVQIWETHMDTDWSNMWAGFRTTVKEEWNGIGEDIKTSAGSITTSIREEGVVWNTAVGAAMDTHTSTIAEKGGQAAAEYVGWIERAKTGGSIVLTLMQTMTKTTLSAIAADWSQEWSAMGARMDGIFAGMDTFLAMWWEDQRSTFKTQVVGLAADLASGYGSIDTATRSTWEGTKAWFKTYFWGGVLAESNEGVQNLNKDLNQTEGRGHPSVVSNTRAIWDGLKIYLGVWWDDVNVRSNGGLDALGILMNQKFSSIDTNTRSIFAGLGIYFGVFWEESKSRFQAALDWFNGPFMAGMRAWWQTKVDGWNRTVEAIGLGWEIIKDKIRAPIQKVIDVVYNNGIVPVWNNIATSFGASKLNTYTLPQWREGGPVRGRGTETSDSIVGRLSHNEHVWTAKEVHAAGGHQAVAALRSAVLGGGRVRVYGDGAFAEGGGVMSWLGDRLGDLGQAARGAIYPIAEPILTRIKNTGVDLVKSIVPGDGNALEQAATGFVRVPVDKILDWLKTNDVVVTHGVDMPWPMMWGVVRKQFPDATLTSGYRSGDPGYHGKGRAIDVAWPMTVGGKGRMLDLNRWLATNYPMSTELIHTPGINLKNGKPMNYSSETQAAHWDHVHWAMAGTGGGSGSPGNVQGWRDLVVAELAHFGQSPSLADMVLRRLNQESGGNARAINTWDSNAKAGTPSKGLMQVIDPTFNAYKNTRMHPDDIWDPAANIHAAFNYAFARYGSLENAFNRAGGYLLGTKGALAGIHTVAENGMELITRGPTPVRFRGGEKVWNARDTRELIGGRGGDTYKVDLHIAPGVSADTVRAAKDELVPELIRALKQGTKKR